MLILKCPLISIEFTRFHKNVKLIGLRPKIQKIFYSTYKSIRNFLVDFFSVKIFGFKIYYG